MSNTPYLLGRLFAALVDQQVMQPTQWQGKVSTLTLAIRAAGDKDALAPIVEALPVEALSGDDMLPEDESDFWLGYYHQRAELRKGGRVSAGRPEPEPRLDDRWEIRLEPELKQWALANKGAELVRTFLRDERARRN